MLTIKIPDREWFNDSTQEFITVKGTTLQLEHSLVSLSKWEAKWNTPFLSKEEKTLEQTLDYIRCMTITQNVNPMVYEQLSEDNIEQINKYINTSMTATTFNNLDSKPSREIITSELIYYWMISLNVPMECQKWHLNRLLTLIRVCNAKNAPPKKMSARDIMSRNSALNAARRKKYNTKG